MWLLTCPCSATPAQRHAYRGLLLAPVQALRCLEAAAAGVLQPGAPPGVRQALGSEGAASLLGYLLSLLLQVSWFGGLGHNPRASF